MYSGHSYASPYNMDIPLGEGERNVRTNSSTTSWRLPGRQHGSSLLSSCETRRTEASLRTGPRKRLPFLYSSQRCPLVQGPMVTEPREYSLVEVRGPFQVGDIITSLLAVVKRSRDFYSSKNRDIEALPRRFFRSSCEGSPQSGPISLEED